MRNVLISTDKQDVINSINRFIGDNNNIDKCHGIDQIIYMLKTKAYNILFLDIENIQETSSGKHSVEVYKTIFKSLFETQPTLEIVAMASRDRIRQTVMAVKAGANDFLSFPLVEDEVKLLISDIYESRVLQSELEHLRDEFWDIDTQDDLKTKSTMMRKVLDQIKTVAPTRSTVLLLGDTGTGKSRLAKLIHAHSSRKDGPFISVNCGAIPDTLIESELFGHEKGAFTGAIRLKLGKFEIARGGTLFLDEIGTISPAAQIKLLSVIQEAEFQRVGGENAIKADIRLLTATNENLVKLVEEGSFRKDLFYRLNVFPITIPSLHQRKEDIPLLTDQLIQKLNRVNGKSIKGIQPAVLSALQLYLWPGNIRELENLLERAHILESTDYLTTESFPQEIFQNAGPTTTVSIGFPMTLADVRNEAVNQAERSYLKELLSRNKGKIAPSATEAGISTRQLSKLLAKHQIRKGEYKKKSVVG